VRFVVMQNLFCSELSIHRRYDLKGSTMGRSVGEEAAEVRA
jgi:1-phosphatidylinositol-4-phosphate 5-kinase